MRKAMDFLTMTILIICSFWFSIEAVLGQSGPIGSMRVIALALCCGVSASCIASRHLKP